jgi:hypothetical protein
MPANGVSGAFQGIFYAPALNDAGQMAFNAWIVPSGAPGQLPGVFIASPNAAEVVSLEGNPAPGTEGNFGGISRHYPPLNSDGETAFSIEIRNPANGQISGRAIYKGNSSALELVAQTGMAAPGTDATFNIPYGSTIPLNSSGDVAFVASLAGTGVNNTNDYGLWRTRGENLELVVRKGDFVTTEGTTEHFSSIVDSYLIDDTDQVVFRTYTSNVLPVTTMSLWSARDGELRLIARHGMAAPGTSDTFTDMGANYKIATNKLGQIAFHASAGSKGGIWAQDPTGALRLIARAGDSIEIAPGDVRTIATFDSLFLSNGSDGKARSFNDAGQIVFNVNFVGGGKGIFVSDAAGYCLADFNRDGAVDGDDLAEWQTAYQMGSGAADADGDGDSDGRDFLVWQRQSGFGNAAAAGMVVPEPASAITGLVMVVYLGLGRPSGCRRAVIS